MKKMIIICVMFAIANSALAQESKVIKAEKITSEEIIQYLQKVSSLSPDQKAEKYFNANQKSVEYINKLNWPAIRNFNYGLTVKSPPFQHLILNREKFYRLYGIDSVDDIIRSTYASAMNGFLFDSFSVEPDTESYKNLRKELMALKIPSADRLVLGMDLSLYETAGNWEQYAKTAVLHIERYSYDNCQELNYIAFSFFENINDKAYLAKALNWAKCSTELNTDPVYIDTYKKLLAKLNAK